MSDLVRVPYGDSASDTATLLLEAAGKKGNGPEDVRVVSSGSSGNEFEVPEEVAKAAGVDYNSDDDEAATDDTEPAKTAAKKTTAKKTAAKKSARK